MAEQQMDKKYTVLILAAPIGFGHILAAQALVEALKRYDNVRVLTGDFFTFLPAGLTRPLLRCYFWLLEHLPFIYEYSYRWGNRSANSLLLRGFFYRLLAYFAGPWLETIQPDAVLATHATPLGLAACYKIKRPELFLGAVVPDFSLHRWWLNEAVDIYFLADERLKEHLPAKANYRACGIPLRQQFIHLEKASCRKHLAWSDAERVILLLGGGEGLLPMEKILSTLAKTTFTGRLVLITGHNEKLAKRLLAKSVCCAFRTEIFGFREDLPQLIMAADLIISKAGGLSTAEILAAGTPYLLYHPLPGQEKDNADFLVRHYGARVCSDMAAVVEAILARDEEIIRPNIPNGKARAAEAICEALLAELKRTKG